MNKTKIEWADYTWNPVTGCLHGCPYCYARGVATRFNGGYGERGEIHVLDEPLRDHWRDEDAGKVVEGPKAAYPYGFDPTFHRYKLDEPGRKAKGAVIFVGSMTDLFGDWVPQEWIEAVFWACQQAPQHTYLFLTKNPGRLMDLAEAGKLPTFDNFWYGSTTTTPDTPFFWSGLHHTFVSVEPILAPFIMATNKVEWAIFGAETGNRRDKVRPTWGWIEGAVNDLGLAGVPVFMKDSLKGIAPFMLRQTPPQVALQTKGGAAHA